MEKPVNDQAPKEKSTGIKQEAPQPTLEETQKLNAVRDLLFGPNDQEYREKFELLKNRIEEYQSKASQDIEELRNSLGERIDALEQALTEKIEQLSADKADRKKMAALLHHIANELEG